jgi:DNA-binding HxlR family transcriptional regulator
MLSLRLRELEQKRLVRRHVIAGPPVRVTYELTRAGRGFREVSDAVRRWGATIVLARKESAIIMETPALAKRRKAGASREVRPNVQKARRA